MNRTDNNNAARHSKLIGLALTTALASATLTGCAASAPPAALSAGKAEVALANGKSSKAIAHAESAVQADPRNAAYRAMLGAAYLDSGRFASAATSFDDAMKLGDTSPRTALSLALALTAQGKQREAVAVLKVREGEIAPGDLGLAYALAGRPDQGINVLSNALRGGENTAKIRQNLAYSFALAGRWKEARLMAAEDVPADLLGDRMAAWAAEVQPGAFRTRVAALLSVPADMRDPGQPVQLALANFPTSEQLAAEASASAAPAPLAIALPESPAQAPAIAIAKPAAQPAQSKEPAQSKTGELPPIGDAAVPSVAANSNQAQSAPEPENFQAAFKSPTPAGASVAAVAMDAKRFVQQPTVQQAPQRTETRNSVTPAPKAQPAAPLAVASTDGTHLVQLGSFSSEQGARRAWKIYVQRYPELASHDMVITQAVVHGKNYWRVSAAGYDARSSSAMCGRVKSASGEGCFAYAESKPLPGAIDNGRRFAMR